MELSELSHSPGHTDDFYNVQHKNNNVRKTIHGRNTNMKFMELWKSFSSGKIISTGAHSVKMKNLVLIQFVKIYLGHLKKTFMKAKQLRKWNKFLRRKQKNFKRDDNLMKNIKIYSRNKEL